MSSLLEKYVDQASGPVILIDYKNWRGERRLRRIRVINWRLSEPNNPYHPPNEWLCWAVDLEDNEIKGFALSGIYKWDSLKEPIAVSK